MLNHSPTMLKRCGTSLTGESPCCPHSKLLALSSTKQTTLLLESGFRMKDIVSVSNECGKIQKKRSTTTHTNEAEMGAVLGRSSGGGTASDDEKKAETIKPERLWNKARENIKKMTSSSRTVATTL
jgi:hypothetical protein